MPLRRRRIIKKITLKDLEGKDRVLTQRNKYVFVSNEIDVYNEEEYNKDPLLLATQFFIHSDPERQKEFLFCLKENIKVFDKIYLLNEKIYSQEDLGLDDKQMEKITQIDIEKRLTYFDIIKYFSKIESPYYLTFCNLDIFFDLSFSRNIRRTSLSERKTMRALTRREFSFDNKLEECKIRSGFRQGYSQDSWCFHSNFLPELNEKTKETDFLFGKLGCDNKFAMIVFELGYKIINDSNFLKTYHYHKTEIRDYNKKDRLNPPYLWVAVV